MMTQPTYKQMIEQGLVTFPTTVDAALKATIYDWFQYREVCDKEQFPNFFFRTLSMSMRKYNELLAIEPGQPFTDDDGNTKIVTYDWLVQNYREKMLRTDISGTSLKTITGDGESTKTVTGTSGRSTHMIGEDITDEDTTGSRGTVVDSETHVTVDSETSGTSSMSSESDQTGSTSNTSSNSEKALAKADPQSISYGSALAPQAGLPANLDWSYPGTQQESAGSGTDSGTSSNSIESSSSGSTSSETDGTTDTEHDSTTTENHTDARDIKFDTERTTTESGTKSETLTDTNESSTEEAGEHNDQSISREQENGRSVDIATLLTGAKSFILGSSAWDYLYGQIDKCFQGVIMEW